MKFFLFFASILAAQEFDPWSIISSENEPSALIEGSVNAISGAWCVNETDLVIQGAQPIVIRRVLVDGKWSLFPNIEIVLSGTKKKIIRESTGANICYRRVEKGGKFQKFIASDLDYGYTNTSRGPISSRTNIRNNVLLVGHKDKELILHACDGTVKTYQKIHHSDEYLLVSEHLMNGNWILYDYKKNSLSSIRTTNPSQTREYARAEFFYESGNVSIVGSDGQRAVFWYRKGDLEVVASPLHPVQKFEYYKQRDLSTILLPEDRFLKVNFYKIDTTDVNGHPVKMEHSTYEWRDNGEIYENIIYDPRCGRVKTIGTPIGTTASILYDLHNRKTTVYDIENQKAEYLWDNHFRLKEIIQNQTVLRFTWNDKGYLLCKTLLDINGQELWSKQYFYNDRGDVLEEKFCGYSKRFSYTNTRISLLKSVEEDNGLRIEYEYLPDTDLCTSQIISFKGEVQEKKIWEYDADHLLLREIHETPITRIVRQFQYLENGLPCLIEEPAGKVYLHYTTGGKVAQKDIYDSEGNFQYSLTYKYDDKGRIVEQTNVLGDIERFAYDDCGNKIRHETDRKTSTFQYDRCNRLISSHQVGFDGVVLDESYIYDNKHRLTREEKPLGFWANYSYDSNGHLCKKEIPGYSFTYKHDYFGRLIEETDPDGATTCTKYNAYNKPTQIKHPDGGIEEFIYYPDGTLKIAKDQEGVETTYTYDYKQRVTSKTICSLTEYTEYKGDYLTSKIDPEGNRAIYSYDSLGRLQTQEFAGLKTEYRYDPLGRVNEEIIGELHIHKKYDLLDRLIEETKENQKVLYAYDSANNPISIIRGDAKEEFEYDSLDRQTKWIDPLGSVTEKIYEHTPHLKETTIDPQGLKTVKWYSPLQKPIAAETKHYREEFSYNYRNQITHYLHKIPNRTIEIAYRYDCMGRLIELTQDPKKTHHSYDKKGRLIQTVKPGGVSLHYVYNSLNQMTRLFSSDGSISYVYTYDLLGRQITSTDLITGQQTQKAYDPHGHLLQETLANGCTLTNTYDSVGRRTRLILPDSTFIEYKYDALYLREIKRKDYTHTFNEYDAGGRLFKETLVQYGYNLRGQLESTTSPFHQHSVLKRDLVGNILETNTNVFTYDDLYQLSSEKDHTYLTDAQNCRLQKDEETYEIDHLLQMPSHFTYDLNGNPIQQGETQYVYDALDRLVQVKTPAQTIQYGYDADHRRISKNGVYFLYDGQNEIGSMESGVIKELRILGRTQTAEIGSAVLIELQGKPYIPVHDLHGNVLLLIADNQPVIEYKYTAFGEETSHFHNPWRFSSKRHDDETGFIYFGRRYYCPKLGRWLTPDPASFTDGVNLYAFVRNNPLTRFDLYGLYTSDNASSPHYAPDWHREIPIVGDPEGGTIHFWCGIGNSEKSVTEAGYALYELFDHQYAIQAHWIHNESVPFGLMQVGLEKIRKNSAYVAPLLGLAGIGLCHLALEQTDLNWAVNEAVQVFSTLAEEIMANKSAHTVQFHIAFSNAGYVLNQSLQKLPEDYQNTIALFALGTTELVDRNLAMFVLNIIGDKDKASQICNGGIGSILKAQEKSNVNIIEQTEIKSFIRGHYVVQPDYQKRTKVNFDKFVKDTYEIH